MIESYFYFLSPLFVGLAFKLGIAVTKSIACGFASNEEKSDGRNALYEMLAQRKRLAFQQCFVGEPINSSIPYHYTDVMYTVLHILIYLFLQTVSPSA